MFFFYFLLKKYFIFVFRATGRFDDAKFAALIAKGKQDTTTKVEVSLKVYFSESFEKATTDVRGKVAELVASTNQAFDNSKVLIKLVVICIEKYTGPEPYDGGTQFSSFK